MSRLTDNAEKRFRAMSRKTETPEWYPAVGAVVAVLLVLFLAWQFISPNNEGEQASTTTNPLDNPTVTVPAATPTTGGTTDTTTEPAAPGSSTTTPDTSNPQDPETEMVVLVDWTGGSRQIERHALDAARDATVALFTGDFTAVTFADGVTTPALPRTWESPQVDTPTIRSMGDNVVEISFAVDPDGDGPEVIRRIDTAVIHNTDGSWAWLGV